MKLLVGKKNHAYSQVELEETDRPTPDFIRSLAEKYSFEEPSSISGSSTCPHLEFLYDFFARNSPEPANSLLHLSGGKISIAKKEMRVRPWRVLAMRERVSPVGNYLRFSPIYKTLSNWEKDFQSKKLFPVYRSEAFPDPQSFFNYFTALRVLLSQKRVFQSREVVIDEFIYQYVKFSPTSPGETPLPPLPYVESVINMVPLQNLSFFRAILLHQLFSSDELNNLMEEKQISMFLLADVVEANRGMSSVEILEIFDEIPKAWLKKLY